MNKTFEAPIVYEKRIATLNTIFDFEEVVIANTHSDFSDKETIVMICKTCSFIWSARYAVHEKLYLCNCSPSKPGNELIEQLYKLVKT